MRGITPISFSFVYMDKPESPDRLSDAYRGIFIQAWKNIVDKQSTAKYSGGTHDTTTDSGRVSNNRGSSQDSQSDQCNALPNGTEGKNPGGEVRQSVENKFTTPRVTS